MVRLEFGIWILLPISLFEPSIINYTTVQKLFLLYNLKYIHEFVKVSSTGGLMSDVYR